MGEARRLGTEGLVEFDMLRGVGEMVLTTDDMGDFHLNVIDDINEMEDPGAIGTAQSDVGMGAGIGEIEFNPAANLVLQDDLLAGRAEANGSVVLVEMACLFETA